MRSPFVVAVVVALVVVIATAVIFAMTRPGDDLRAQTGDGATAQPTQVAEVVALAGGTDASQPGAERTLLVQLADDDKVAVANLLVVTSGEQATMLWLPSTLLVPAPSPVTLAQTPTDFDTLAAQSGVAALLGVRVDATLVVDRLALVGLVDAVGGMQLDLDEPVAVTDSAGEVTILRAGSRFVDGVDAAAIALAPGTDDEHAVRVSRIVERIARTLPTTPDGQRALLLSLGSSARSSVSNDELVAVLDLLRSSAGADAIRTEVLPVVVLRSGGAGLVAGAASAGASTPAAAAAGLVARTMSEVALRPGQSRLPRVILDTAGVTPVQVATAIAQLTAAGAAVVESDGDLSSSEPSRRTVVYLPDASPAARERGALVTSTLGLPATSVRLWNGPSPAPVDVLVHLGTSFTATG